MNPEQFARFKKTPQFNKKLYDLGRIAEVEVLDTLKVFFNDKSIIPLPEGHSFDFEGVNKYIELKSRRVYRLAYEDTAIGRTKIHKALADKSRDYYFVFKFINGLYYVKLDETVQLRLGDIKGISHYFISVSILTKIE